MDQPGYNKFDRVLQENVRKITLPFLGRLLDFKEAEFVYLDRKIHRTLEREMDTLLKYKYANGFTGLLDLEWQAANDPKMAMRMLLYHAIAINVYDLPVIGVVIYIGSETLNMPPGIDTENLKYNYRLIDFTTLNPSAFIDSCIPEEVIMAILAGRPDFRQKREIVRKILYKLQLLLRHDENELNRKLGQFEIIGKLRGAQKIIKEEEEIMALTYDIETDIRYIQGLENGRTQGSISEKTAFVIYLLKNTSHTLDEIAKFTNASIDFIMNVKKSIEHSA